MSGRTDRVEARLAPDERERIRCAAELRHTSTSSFMVSAALEKADEVLGSFRATAVPSDYFNQLLASLDDTSTISELERAVQATSPGDSVFSRR